MQGWLSAGIIEWLGLCCSYSSSTPLHLLGMMFRADVVIAPPAVYNMMLYKWHDALDCH